VKISIRSRPDDLTDGAPSERREAVETSTHALASAEAVLDSADEILDASDAAVESSDRVLARLLRRALLN
jgi:hypothetical protein